MLADLRIPVVLIEQPLQKNNIKGSAYIKKRSYFPIAADESFRTLKDLKKIVEQDAADVFNIKIAKCGLTESMRIVDYLRKMKKEMMLGCMMESMIGLAAPLHWAIGSGIFKTIDLDSFLLLKDTPIQSPFNVKNAALRIGINSPGSGIAFDDEDLKR